MFDRRLHINGRVFYSTMHSRSDASCFDAAHESVKRANSLRDFRPSFTQGAMRPGSRGQFEARRMHEALRRQRLVARGDRPLLLIPVFGIVLVAGLWLAIVNRLDSEREATLASAMRATEGFARAFAAYSIRELRDIDRTTQLVKAQFERNGVVDSIS
jgi:hypothetical protein